MATINSIYRGMQNGPETINENQTKINDELKAFGDAAVHKTGKETLSGEKTFSGKVTFTSDVIERTVTTTIAGPYTISCILRRTGNIVEFISDRTIVPNPTAHEQSDAGVTFPLGYRPISRALAQFELSNNSTFFSPMLLRIDSNGNSYLTNEAYSGNRYAQCYAMWVTADAWPTS